MQLLFNRMERSCWFRGQFDALSHICRRMIEAALLTVIYSRKRLESSNRRQKGFGVVTDQDEGRPAESW